MGVFEYRHYHKNGVAVKGLPYLEDVPVSRKGRPKKNPSLEEQFNKEFFDIRFMCKRIGVTFAGNYHKNVNRSLFKVIKFIKKWHGKTLFADTLNPLDLNSDALAQFLDKSAWWVNIMLEIDEFIPEFAIKEATMDNTIVRGNAQMSITHLRNLLYAAKRLTREQFTNLYAYYKANLKDISCKDKEYVVNLTDYFRYAMST